MPRAATTASTLTTRDLGALDWPVDGHDPLSVRTRREPEQHDDPLERDRDWRAVGTAVRAVESGVVVVAEPIGTYGPTVISQHGGGDYSVYGSLSRIDVKKGSHVERGEVIGAVGRSDPDLPAHLHFEIRRDQGRAVDPLEWLRGGTSR